MAEPTVQVPASLIKLAVHYLSRGGFRALAGQLQDALLSQPTPTAAAPRIEDMAPGTTFTAGLRDDRIDAPRIYLVWRVLKSGALWNAETDTSVHPRRIDPATIRDVTPPKED